LKDARNANLKKKLPIVLFSGEKYFNVNQVINSQTDRFITNKKSKAAPPEVKSLQKSKHPAQIMIFGLVASNGLKMAPVFFESGFRMGAKDYLELILKSHVLPWINFPNNKNVVLIRPELAEREHKFLAKRCLASQFARFESPGFLSLCVCSVKGL
jgi:hypothetical protein